MTRARGDFLAFATCLALAALLIGWGLGASRMAGPQEVAWQGWPVLAGPYRGIDPGFYGGGTPPPAIFVDTEHELGLRADGVCVWRAAPAPPVLNPGGEVPQ